MNCVVAAGLCLAMLTTHLLVIHGKPVSIAKSGFMNLVVNL